MDTWIALLQGYQSRDKLLRTACYASVLLTGGIKGKMARDLGIFAKQISSARVVLRLFDDIPMWMATRKWGAPETDSLSRLCVALGNLAMQFFYPFEKLTWASEVGILPYKTKAFLTGGLACWAVYLMFGIIRNLRQISLMRLKIAKLVQQRKLESPEKSGEKDAEFRRRIGELKRKQGTEFLTLMKNISDIVMAINFFPFSGFLWSSKLSPAQNAFFGTLGSLIGLYFCVRDIRTAKKTE